MWPFAISRVFSPSLATCFSAVHDKSWQGKLPCFYSFWIYCSLSPLSTQLLSVYLSRFGPSCSSLKFPLTLNQAELDHPNTYIWRRQWHPTPVPLPGKPHGRRSLVGCSPWARSESDTTERLHFHFSLSCIGEGNGNPLQCSCLENPRDGGAWWAAVYGVAQSWTRLKRLSSSSSNTYITPLWQNWSPCSAVPGLLGSFVLDHELFQGFLFYHQQ